MMLLPKADRRQNTVEPALSVRLPFSRSVPVMLRMPPAMVPPLFTVTLCAKALPCSLAPLFTVMSPVVSTLPVELFSSSVPPSTVMGAVWPGVTSVSLPVPTLVRRAHFSSPEKRVSVLRNPT